LARHFWLLPQTGRNLAENNWHHFSCNAIFEIVVRLLKVISAIQTERTETGAQ
jgi:hypothetical protein